MSNAITFTGTLGKRVLSTYVDPHPGLKGTDRVQTPCGRCVNQSGYIRAFAHVQGGICFECNGAGTVGITVNTVRRWAKQDAYSDEFGAEIRAIQEWLAAESNAKMAQAQFAADWDDAHAEAARRAAVVQGFVGEVDEKVTVTGTVKVAKYCEAQAHNRSATMFVIVETVAGQVIKISGSSASLFDLERGDQVELAGTVKAHESYRGQDQTTLFRVKATVLNQAA